MSLLLRVSELRPQEEQEVTAAAMIPSGARWLPSHVQVTVVQARALRPKGGPGDVFAVLQLGRQKHRTSVATLKGDGPRWDEECALEMPPSSAPDELEAEALLLRLTVWQRALVGMDRFLGRAAVPLAALLEGGRSHQDQWYKLHSKPGKKEKERGEIQLSIQFTRHSLTASMFDLSVKDKPRSPFGRLRDKVKGRRKYDLESASAIVPSSSGALDDDGGDFDLAGKKAKARVGGGGGFFRGRLRKSSLTQSNASLGSDSTVSSAGSTAGLGAAERTAPSPSRHGSLSTDRSVRDFLSSPKLTHKRAFSDEVSQINALPESKSVQGLRPQNESRSSLCINGSHVYCDEPSPKPAFLSTAAPPPQSTLSEPGASLGTGPRAPEPELPPWSSSSFQKGPPKDPPRFIPSPPILAAQEEDKLSVKTIALNKHRGRGRREEGLHADSRPVQIATPMVFSSEVVRVRPREEEERAKAGVLRRGSSKDGDGRRLLGDCPKGPSKAAEEQDGSGQRGLQDAKESLPRPSFPPELATPEVAKNACLAADRGPAAFVGVGELQVEAAATKPPLDWDDSFDAFASSRLRPEAWRGAPQPPAATVDGRAPAGGRGGAGPCESEAEPGGHAGPPSASGGLPGRLGGARPERGPDDAAQPQGATCAPGAPEEASWAGGPAGSQQRQRGQGAREGGPWRGGRPASSAGATAVPSDSGPAPGQAASRPALAEEEGSPPALEGAAWLRHGEGPAEEADCLADQHGWDRGRQEQTASLMSPHGGRREEVAGGAPLKPGRGPEGGEGQAAMPAQEQEGTGEARPAEPPPPKPPRRLTPLSLEEEARKASGGTRVAGWLGGALACEPREDPAGEACQQGPPTGQAAVLIGSGGGALGRALEAFGLAADSTGPGPADKRSSQAVPPEEAVLAAGEEASAAEQFTACPSPLSRGGLGPAGAQEEAGCGEGGEPSLPPWAAQGPAELPGQASVQTAQELPGPGGAGGARPSGALQESEASPATLLWAAWQGGRRLLPQDCPGWERPREPALRESGFLSRQEEGDGRGLASSWGEPAGGSRIQAPPPGLPHSPLSARGQSRGRSWVGESELASSWSEDGVVDFKRADFWQVARGGQSSSSTCDSVELPGNPFASWTGPPAKNNPFVGERPGVPPAPASLAGGFRGLDAGAALPARSEAQPLAASTPSLAAAPHPGGFDFPSPIAQLASSGGSAQPTLALPQLSGVASAPSALPTEAPPAEEGLLQQTTSPHLVKPISTPVPETSGQEQQQQPSQRPVPSGQQAPRPSSVDSAAPVLQLDSTEPKRDPPVRDPSAKYYHLTHEELVQLLLRREAELGRKQEQVQELESYIDRLLVRIMEQSPTLLQIPLGGEPEAAQ